MSLEKQMIFLSHSHADIESAMLLESFLEDRGFPCWLASKHLSGYQTISQGISEAIENSSQIVVVASEHTRASEWVEAEWATAMDEKKPAHVVRFDDSRLPLFLRARNAIDASGEQYEIGLSRLLDEIKRAAHESM